MKKPLSTPAAGEVSVEILVPVLHHGEIYAKKGDVVAVSKDLAAAWVKAAYAKLAS